MRTNRFSLFHDLLSFRFDLLPATSDRFSCFSTPFESTANRRFAPVCLERYPFPENVYVVGHVDLGSRSTFFPFPLPGTLRP